ncbi:MAG: hypothetical protein H6Q69_1049 [Firmicutes bacterium]|nr:hypothetical protein [Bacillota bacterium]
MTLQVYLIPTSPPFTRCSLLLIIVRFIKKRLAKPLYHKGCKAFYCLFPLNLMVQPLRWVLFLLKEKLQEANAMLGICAT